VTEGFWCDGAEESPAKKHFVKCGSGLELGFPVLSKGIKGVNKS